MRKSSHIRITLLVAGTLASQAVLQTARATDAATPAPVPMELAVDYSFLRSNAPPNECHCFNLNGASATFALPLGPRPWALVADFTIAHSGNIAPLRYDLTLDTFTVGARYSPIFWHGPFQPFAQLLVGVAHATGSLESSATNAFAADIGAGLDWRINRRIAIRMFEADYVTTTFSNGSDDHQNILRLSTGVVARF